MEILYPGLKEKHFNWKSRQLSYKVYISLNHKLSFYNYHKKLNQLCHFESSVENKYVKNVKILIKMENNCYKTVYDLVKYKLYRIIVFESQLKYFSFKSSNQGRVFPSKQFLKIVFLLFNIFFA